MYIKQFKIKGNNVIELIDLINKDLKIISYNPVESVHIFVSEKYYFRTNSQLMTFLIVKIEDDYNAIMDIVTGGGATGLFGVDFGVEESRSEEIEKILKAIGENKSWDISETRIDDI